MNSAIQYPESSYNFSNKIKICGLTRLEDIVAVNEILPDYIGLVFAPSPRQVTASKATELKKLLDPSILAVGVFVNEDMDNIISLCRSGTLDMVQLHGDEDLEYIELLKKIIPHPIIKAIRVRDSEDMNKANQLPCDYLLLDSYKEGSYGGNGATFDWSLISDITKPFFLAGGIHTENVLGAIKQCKPFCIDVSSSVETNKLKDPEKIVKIVQLVRNQNMI